MHAREGLQLECLDKGTLLPRPSTSAGTDRNRKDNVPHIFKHLNVGDVSGSRGVDYEYGCPLGFCVV
jgi:hypothetical protein